MITTLTLLALLSAAQHVHPAPATTPAAAATSTLTAEAVQQLLDGDGMGLAKPAEMNSYPGPKHVLELKKELALTPELEQKVEAIRQEMLAKAKVLGRQIVDAERALDAAFKAGTITDADLAARVSAIATLQGELRSAHLRAHLQTKPLLSLEQVRIYYQHRAHQH